MVDPPEGFGAAADQLYRSPPGRFVATRDDLVRRARSAGDRPLADALAALRRPSAAAWAVNLLARAESAQLDAVLALGAELRAAQRELQGDELRALARQRREVIGAVAKRAGALAKAEGSPLNPAAAAAVEETLAAALANPDIARQVRAGMLTTPLRYGGLGEGVDGAEPTVDGPDQELNPDEVARQRIRRRDRLRQELADARRERDSAVAAAESAAADVARAERERAHRASRIEELRAELADLETRARDADSTDMALRRAARLADTARDQVERRVRALTDRLSDD